jgi:DNA polymerase III subunit gamma/tau
MRVLTRMWQMLLKALEEVALAPNAMMAAEMAIIRLTHVADLPDPETLIRKLQSTQPAPTGGAPAGGGGGVVHATTRLHAPAMGAVHGATMQGGQSAAVALAPGALESYVTFERVIDLIRERRDMKLLVEVETTLRLAKYSPGRIEFEPTAEAPRDLAARLAARLQGWTGARWAVTVVNTGGAATIAEDQDKDRIEAEAKAMENPLVQAVFTAFPGAKITAMRKPELEAAFEALPEVEDEWDPFEEG